MPRVLRRLTVALLCLLAAGAALALEPIYAQRGVAIRGYDPVAYFTETRPVQGVQAHTLQWNGAQWRFASQNNLEAFRKNPTRYAPQYGGYCAWAVSNNYTASTDPHAWTVVDGKLYLNYSLRVRARWSQNIPRRIKQGDANWPRLCPDCAS